MNKIQCFEGQYNKALFYAKVGRFFCRRPIYPSATLSAQYRTKESGCGVFIIIHSGYIYSIHYRAYGARVSQAGFV